MKNLNRFGYTKIEVLVIIVLLGIVAFITINNTADVFATDASLHILELKSLIENQAMEYATDHKELFTESDTNYITVDELVEDGYMIANAEGFVVNPDNPEKTLNDNKIKVMYNSTENKIIATFID